MAAVPSRLTRGVLVLVAALLCVISAPAAAQAPPATQPRRIVSLVPATTEMLYDIGAGNRVVGVGTYDHYPPAVEALPKLGGLLDPNIEQLLALRPDLVIVYETQTELRQRLDRARIPQWSYGIKALGDVSATMRTLGARIGMAAEGNAAADRLDARLAAVRSAVAGRRKPRTLLVFGRENGSLRGINASGGYGFLHDLLELAGGTDVLADVKQAAVAMSSEMVLARAPDAIVELHYGSQWTTAQLETERRAWSALPAVPAVRSNRVYLVAGDEFVVPGPRVALVAERLARTLHPDAFR